MELNWLEGSISRGGALAQCRGFGTCGWKGVGTPDRRPNLPVGPADATARATLNGLGATARAPASSPTTLAEGRSCLGVGPTRKPVLKDRGLPATTSRARPLCKTEGRDRGLDFVARDNPADSLTPQDRRCLPYPHSTGPGSTRQGVGPTRAGRRRATAPVATAGCSTIRGAPPLSASQAGFGLPAGCQ
jgi:hypothetical protein